MAIRTGPTLADIEAARERLAGSGARYAGLHVRDALAAAGRPRLLKAENLQRTGSFKIRGAFNRLATLTDEERAAGVVAASAGNHGQAVAWAAREAGRSATIFIPQDAPMAKVEATRTYGAEVVLVGDGFDEADDRGPGASGGRRDVRPSFRGRARRSRARGRSASSSPSRSASSRRSSCRSAAAGSRRGSRSRSTRLARRCKLVGVQAEPARRLRRRRARAHDRGRHRGQEARRADEPILADRLDDVVTVSDDEIAQAIVLLLERVKLVVEGAGAASVAALLGGKVEANGPACALLSGGNIDATLLIEIARHGLTQAGRFLVLRTQVDDRPGALARFSASSPRAGERPRRRAPPRGLRPPRGRDGSRAHSRRRGTRSTATS